jgi:hypothetical protein
MKRFLVTVSASLICLAVFAQGRVRDVNDSLHLVYYDSGPLMGQAVYDGNMMPGITLVEDLYLGTDSSTLWRYCTATFGSIPGEWNSMSIPTIGSGFPNSAPGAPLLLAGTQVHVLVQVRDQAFPPEDAWTPSTLPFGTYYGTSAEFDFTLGGHTPAYPTLYGTNGDWPAGTYNMDSYGLGFRGAIPVTIPEPSSFAILVWVGTLRLLRSRMCRLSTNDAAHVSFDTLHAS